MKAGQIWQRAQRLAAEKGGDVASWVRRMARAGGRASSRSKAARRREVQLQEARGLR
jgi:hypothetical protein